MLFKNEKKKKNNLIKFKQKSVKWENWIQKCVNKQDYRCNSRVLQSFIR